MQIEWENSRIVSFLLCETNLAAIQSVIEKETPDVAVIDSIQTMYNEEVSSAPGSVSQVRESTNVLMQLAKGLNISTFYRGTCDKGRNGCRPESTGTYGGYGPLF